VRLAREREARAVAVRADESGSGAEAGREDEERGNGVMVWLERDIEAIAGMKESVALAGAYVVRKYAVAIDSGEGCRDWRDSQGEAERLLILSDRSPVGAVGADLVAVGCLERWTFWATVSDSSRRHRVHWSGYPGQSILARTHWVQPSSFRSH